MTAVFITVYRQRTQPKINEERSVQGQINQIIQISNNTKESHVMLKDVAFFNIQFVDQFRVQFWRIKMQLINIHLADKGHWLLNLQNIDL